MPAPVSLGSSAWAIIWGVNPRKRTLPLILAGIVSLAAACGRETAAPPPAPTIAVETPTPPRAVPSTTQPAADSAPVGATPRPRGDCVNDAQFLEDVTIPDGTLLDPGVTIEKRWAVRNSGTCDWGPGYSLVRIGADGFEGPQRIDLYPARAGASAEWRVTLKVPSSPGEHISRWQAQSPEGIPFGVEVFLLIQVPEPTATPTPTRTPRP